MLGGVSDLLGGCTHGCQQTHQVAPMTNHRCRVEKLRAHTLIWKVTCYTCGDRYLTDGGWYDAMGQARKHWDARQNRQP